MSMDIYIYPLYYYHNQDAKHISHFQKLYVLLWVLFVFVVRTLNISSILLTYFKVHNIVLLIIDIMLYSRSLELAYLAY